MAERRDILEGCRLEKARRFRGDDWALICAARDIVHRNVELTCDSTRVAVAALFVRCIVENSETEEAVAIRPSNERCCSRVVIGGTVDLHGNEDLAGPIGVLREEQLGQVISVVQREYTIKLEEKILVHLARSRLETLPAATAVDEEDGGWTDLFAEVIVGWEPDMFRERYFASFPAIGGFDCEHEGTERRAVCAAPYSYNDPAWE